MLKLRKKILSEPLSEIFNLSVQLGEFPDKLKHAKIILEIKVKMRATQVITDQFPYY